MNIDIYIVQVLVKRRADTVIFKVDAGINYTNPVNLDIETG